PSPTLFPYATLFRSGVARVGHRDVRPPVDQRVEVGKAALLVQVVGLPPLGQLLNAGLVVGDPEALDVQPLLDRVEVHPGPADGGRQAAHGLRHRHAYRGETVGRVVVGGGLVLLPSGVVELGDKVVYVPGIRFVSHAAPPPSCSGSSCSSTRPDVRRKPAQRTPPRRSFGSNPWTPCGSQ